MTRQTKATRQAAAAVARESKKNLPPNHFKKLAADRKKKMGPISRQETYPQHKLMALAGWGDSAWRNAVKAGLECYRHGVQLYVTGEAYFRWIEKQSAAQALDN